MTQDEFVELLKNDVVNIGVKGVVSFITQKCVELGAPTLAGWLTGGPLGWLLTWVVTKVLTIAVFYTELGAYIVRTELITAAQARAYEDAAIQNREIQANGTDDQKKQAELNQINAARACIKFAA